MNESLKNPEPTASLEARMVALKAKKLRQERGPENSIEPSAEDYKQALAVVEEMERAARKEPRLKAAAFKLIKLSWLTANRGLEIIDRVLDYYPKDGSYAGLGAPFIETESEFETLMERLTSAREKLKGLKKEADKITKNKK